MANMAMTLWKLQGIGICMIGNDWWYGSTSGSLSATKKGHPPTSIQKSTSEVIEDHPGTFTSESQDKFQPFLKAGWPWQIIIEIQDWHVHAWVLHLQILFRPWIKKECHASLPVSKRSFVLDLDRSNATFVFFIRKNAHFALSWWQSQYLGWSFADWIHLVSTSQSKLPFHWSGFHMDLISIRIPLKAKWSKKNL